MPRLTPAENAALPHPSQSCRLSHATDLRLRLNGFEIWARPKYGEPRWKRHDVVYTQSEALVLVERMEKR